MQRSRRQIANFFWSGAPESVKGRYEKAISDKALRDCVVARNISLTMVADFAVMHAKESAVGLSNVPVVFLWDSLINTFIDATATPSDFQSVLVDVAKKCQNFPNAYLSVEDVEKLKRKSLPREEHWSYFQILIDLM